MTIQQAYQKLNLTGSENFDTVEKQFIELYNDTHTRVVNEFDESHVQELQQHLDELQQALNTLKDIPAATPSATLPEPNLTYTEFMQALGLPASASSKQVAKSLKVKRNNLCDLSQNSLSLEMSQLAEKELRRLDRAAVAFQPSGNARNTPFGRMLRAALLVVGMLGVVSVGAVTVWNFVSNRESERTRYVAETREALRLADFEKAYNLYSDNTRPWLKDSVTGETRRELVCGYLDLTFEKTQKAVQEEALENAKSLARKLKSAKKELDPAWGYAWEKKASALGAIIFEQKTKATAAKDHPKVGAYQVIRKELLSDSEIDNEDWQIALEANTLDGFQKYIDAHKDGKYVQEAQEQISIFKGNEKARQAKLAEYRNIVAQAQEAQTSGKLDAAIELYQQARSKNPGGSEAEKGIRECKQRQQQIEDDKRRDEEAYQAARNSKDPNALRLYASKGGRFASEAATYAVKLEKDAEVKKQAEDDESHWRQIRNSEEVGDFEGYLNAFPNGKHALEAKTKIKEIKKRQKEEAEVKRREYARMNCSLCHGTGEKNATEDCYTCDAKGSIRSGTKTCGTCDGTGGSRRHCSRCGGTGKALCQTCSGDGIVWGCGGDGVTWGCRCNRCVKGRHTNCNQCGSTGYDGFNRCYTCSGSKVVPNHITCGQCGGKGKKQIKVPCHH